MMDRESLSKGLKAMVDSNAGPYDIAVGIRLSQDINHPTTITIKDLGEVRTPVSLEVCD